MCRMKLGWKRVLAGCAAVVVTVAMSLALGGRAGAAVSCQRTVAINPQVTVGEGAGRLIFTVFSGECAAAGQVAYTVTAGTAQPTADFVLSAGQVRWGTGDFGARTIIATVVGDTLREADLEDFTVTLTNPSPAVRLIHATGHGRILDDDRLGLAWAIDDQFCPAPPLVMPVPPGDPWLTAEQRYLCDFGHGVIDAMPDTPLPGPVTLIWETVDGTARAGVDFVRVAQQTQSVPAGATLVELPVRLLSRPTGTPSRWFQVRIVASSHGTVVDAVAVVTLGGS
jgi:hypothetical protein